MNLLNRSPFLFSIAAVMCATVTQAQSTYPFVRTKPSGFDFEVTNQSPRQFDREVALHQYLVTLDWVQKDGTCERLKCEYEPGQGSGKSELWDAYFSARKEDKPAKLAYAISGIKEDVARAMIKRGFFSSKPRSWSEFSIEIINAQKALRADGYNKDFATLVLEVEGVENARRLGYDVTKNCQKELYACKYWKQEERESFLRYEYRQVRVEVGGQLLQSFESDRLRATVDERGISISERYPLFNRYQTDVTRGASNDLYVKLTAIKRNLVAFPAQSGQASLSKTTNGFRLSLTMDPKYLPKSDDPGSSVVLRYKICHTLLGNCWKQLSSGETTVRGTSAAVDFNGGFKNRSRYKAFYKLVRLGSRYYGSDGVEQSTPAIRY